MPKHLYNWSLSLSFLYSSYPPSLGLSHPLHGSASQGFFNLFWLYINRYLNILTPAYRISASLSGKLMSLVTELTDFGGKEMVKGANFPKTTQLVRAQDRDLKINTILWIGREFGNNCGSWSFWGVWLQNWSRDFRCELIFISLFIISPDFLACHILRQAVYRKSFISFYLLFFQVQFLDAWNLFTL